MKILKKTFNKFLHKRLEKIFQYSFEILKTGGKDFDSYLSAICSNFKISVKNNSILYRVLINCFNAFCGQSDYNIYLNDLLKIFKECV